MKVKLKIYLSINAKFRNCLGISNEDRATLQEGNEFHIPEIAAMGSLECGSGVENEWQDIEEDAEEMDVPEAFVHAIHDVSR